MPFAIEPMPCSRMPKCRLRPANGSAPAPATGPTSPRPSRACCSTRRDRRSRRSGTAAPPSRAGSLRPSARASPPSCLPSRRRAAASRPSEMRRSRCASHESASAGFALRQRRELRVARACARRCFASMQRREPGAHVVGHEEGRLLRPAERFLGGAHFVRTERRAVRLRLARRDAGCRSRSSCAAGSATGAPSPRAPRRSRARSPRGRCRRRRAARATSAPRSASRRLR